MNNVEEYKVNFEVEIIKARNSETIEEAIKHLKEARYWIGEIEKAIPEMKQIEHDLTQDLYNRLKPSEKLYVKTIKFRK